MKKLLFLLTSILFYKISLSQEYFQKKLSENKKNYKSVTIGSQIWMAQNLNEVRFQNGDTIKVVKTIDQWKKAYESEEPACCYYNFDPKNREKYGMLYNKYALIDKRKIAPTGWQIATTDDWDKLIWFLEGRAPTDKDRPETAGRKLKSQTGWVNNFNSNNTSGFSALPGGYLFPYHLGFVGIGTVSSWWALVSNFPTDPIKYTVYSTSNIVEFGGAGPAQGYYVRCINSISTKLNTENNQLSESTESEIVIGKQTWMTKNLNVDKFRNGEPIPQAKTLEEWENAGINKNPAWCYYLYESANGEKYGKLYNWYAVKDSRGLAPKGWHIPNYEEWSELVLYLGDQAGVKMKSKHGWESISEFEDCNGTNSSGFSGLPSGMCSYDGRFYKIGFSGFWWTYSEEILSRTIGFKLSGCWINEFEEFKTYGFSVRCLRD
jgi:uncharacterized protein (TIGR02145 family)